MIHLGRMGLVLLSDLIIIDFRPLTAAKAVVVFCAPVKIFNLLLLIVRPFYHDRAYLKLLSGYRGPLLLLDGQCCGFII
jgi:hypothetical protein